MDTTTSTSQIDPRGGAGASQARLTIPTQTQRGVGGGKAGLTRPRLSFAAALLATLLSTVASLGFSVAPAAAAALPDGRTLEPVTPLFKGGNLTLPGGAGTISDDGDSFTYGSFGTAGEATSDSTYAPYLAQRSPGGWLSTPLFPPASGTRALGVKDLSADLRGEIFEGVIGDDLHSSFYFYEPATGLLENLTPQGGVSPALPYVSETGASKDLSHVLWSQDIGDSLNFGGQRLIPDNPGTGQTLIEEYGVGTGSPQYRYVGLDNSGSQAGEHLISHCNTYPGHGGVSLGDPVGSVFNAVSATGATVFFTAARCTSFAGGKFSKEPGVEELYARVNANTTVPISQPSIGFCSSEDALVNPTPEQCADAIFQGASEDGSRVYFTTTQPETGGTDTTTNLYLAEIGSSGCEPGHSACLTKMTRVSAGAAEAGVEGLTRITPDGSHAYFVATGVLTAIPNGQGESAQAGAENLYGYDATTATTKFVARLAASDSSLWAASDTRPAQVTPDGRYLIFDSAAQLTPDDTDSAIDAYRYDFTTSNLVRLTTGQGGYDTNGNNDVYAAEVPASNYAEVTYASAGQNFANTVHRAISDDGSYVFFQTAEPLTPTDVNEDQDVYEWHDGAITLLSGGKVHSSGLYNASTTQLVGASHSGRDVFIYTPEILVPGADGFGDIYDARLGGGFPEAQTPTCSGDSCQGPLSTTQAAAVPGTATLTGPGNLTPAVSRPATKPKATTTSQRLTAALKACKAMKSKSKRKTCEQQAHRRFDARKKAKAKKGSARLTINSRRASK